MLANDMRGKGERHMISSRIRLAPASLSTIYQGAFRTSVHTYTGGNITSLLSSSSEEEEHKTVTHCVYAGMKKERDK